jgi:hypothetical protein
MAPPNMLQDMWIVFWIQSKFSGNFRLFPGEFAMVDVAYSALVHFTFVRTMNDTTLTKIILFSSCVLDLSSRAKRRRILYR